MLAPPVNVTLTVVCCPPSSVTWLGAVQPASATPLHTALIVKFVVVVSPSFRATTNWAVSRRPAKTRRGEDGAVIVACQGGAKVTATLSEMHSASLQMLASISLCPGRNVM